MSSFRFLLQYEAFGLLSNSLICQFIVFCVVDGLSYTWWDVLDVTTKKKEKCQKKKCKNIGMTLIIVIKKIMQ